MFIDALTLDAPKRTKDGYMAVRARAARTGTYAYLGSEIDPDNQHGLRDAGVVNVLRDDKTVFDEASARSFIGKPVTDDHPSAPVNATNWRDYARGMIMGAMRDGDYLAFDLLLTDAEAIKKIGDGKRELSNGYAADLEFGDFEAADGTKCVARQEHLGQPRGAGRQGPSRIRMRDRRLPQLAIPRRPRLPSLLDQILTDERTYKRLATVSAIQMRPSPSGGGNPTQDGDILMPHTLIIDGLQVTEVSDQAKAAIEKLQGQFKDANERAAKAEGDLAKLATDKATLEAKVTTLEQQVKDAKLTPAQLRDAAKAFAQTLETAKKLAPAATLADSMDEAEIKRAVVSAKLGDAAKDWSDEQIAVSFDTLAAAQPSGTVDPIRNAMSGGIVNVGDAKAEYVKSRDEARKNLSDSWRNPAPAAA
jgi:hypothetical protein